MTKKKNIQKTLITLHKKIKLNNEQQIKRKKKLITILQIGTKVGVPMDSEYDIYEGWKI